MGEQDFDGRANRQGLSKLTAAYRPHVPV